ncbi:uncharacterized protein NEMAJ01_1315 [Nematocida major]|uniref:uncharacterized protein n=1 Tax=Nematocida major TaxID=1912982 RepID=UPI0020074C36|nr:uncharacterized protein NEMAJ01_1315 [Nematocida major]KAH9386419.1 hypothetical protein NEMAJ01_1315 [Nematocida major]
MAGLFKEENENVYRKFIAQVRQAGFVRVVCVSREVDHFAALFSLLTILEKELIKHEVVWSAHSKGEERVFEVGIGEGCAIENGVVIGAWAEKCPKGVMVMHEGSLAQTVFALCKSLGHLTPDCLWSLCVSMYERTCREEETGWDTLIRKDLEKGQAEEEEFGSSEERENVCPEMRAPQGLHRDLYAEVGRLERDDKEKMSVQIINSVYFPFSRWSTLYEALINDFAIIEELGLFFRRKHTKHCLLENAEYLLNQFLARLGMPVAAAQKASLGSLVGPAQKIAQCSFNRRSVYFKNYQYNSGFSHIEAFYAICHLIKKQAFTEAVFAFRNIKFVSAENGLREYRRVVHDIKKCVERRKVLRVNGVGIVLIPKGVVSYGSDNEISLMKKVFVNVHMLCKARNPHKEIIMVAGVEEGRKCRVFYKEDGCVFWKDTEERLVNDCIRDLLEKLENE